MLGRTICGIQIDGCCGGQRNHLLQGIAEQENNTMYFIIAKLIIAIHVGVVAEVSHMKDVALLDLK